MRNYVFQLATYADTPEILTLYRSLIGTPGCTWDLDYPAEEDICADIKNNALYVIKEGVRIIAAAAIPDDLADLNWDLKNPCELARLGVLTEFHRRGIATLVLENVIKVAKQKGFDGIIMLVSKTNPAAIALYEKFGFKRRGEVFMFEKDWYYYQMCFN